MDYRPLVSVIIPVFNDYSRLALCLDALRGQEYPSERFEVIVIDNGSDENWSRFPARYPEVRFLQEKQAGSYAARNLGIGGSSGAVLAFTDADCIPSRHWIDHGVRRLKSNRKRIVGGHIRLFYAKPDKPTAVELYESVSAFPQERYVKELQFTVTANAFVPRAAFDAAGLFDSGLYSGGDREWCRRAVAKGFDVVYAEDAEVCHPARRTWSQIYRKSLRVAGGRVRDRNALADQGPLRRIVNALLPPFKGMFQMVFREPRLASLGARLRCIAVLCFVHYVPLLEKARLALGGTARR